MITSTKRPIVCLTPVKNEDWILETFLRCALTWADRVIVADQNSDDRSREIASSFNRVEVIENRSGSFNEPERQKMLLDYARRTGPREQILVALDADEVLSSNLHTSEGWKSAVSSPPGTAIQVSLVDLWEHPFQYMRNTGPDSDTWWPIIYVDDGKEHVGNAIHSPRLPSSSNTKTLTDVVMLHWQFCFIERMRSKHRWYRCYERIQFPDKPPEKINRLYNWMDRIEKSMRTCPKEWWIAYANSGIEPKIDRSRAFFWWDWEVLRMFRRHGTALFHPLEIWDVDWESIRLEGTRLSIDGLPKSRIAPPRKQCWLDYPIQQMRKLFKRF